MGVALGETCTAIGFLTVVEHPQHGLFGGYLVLNSAGRPIEFHCTAPVKPNRAQEILYGPTLKPFLYGEQIGRALVAKSTTATVAICTDCEPALELRDYVPMPVVLVLGDRVEPNADSSSPGHAAAPPTLGGRPPLTMPRQPGLRTLEIGGNRLAVRNSRATDADTVAAQLAAVVDGFDLTEPFGRIRNAIEEAQRVAR